MSHVVLEYQRCAATAHGDLRQRGRAALSQSPQIEAVKRAAIQIEREQIRKAYENDLISRETVRSMRDNVSAIEYDLSD